MKSRYHNSQCYSYQTQSQVKDLGTGHPPRASPSRCCDLAENAKWPRTRCETIAAMDRAVARQRLVNDPIILGSRGCLRLRLRLVAG